MWVKFSNDELLTLSHACFEVQALKQDMFPLM